MVELPDLFRRYSTQLWYIVLSAAFFFVFMVVYQPFGVHEAFDMGRGLFIVNVAILTSIVFLTLLICRTIFFFFSQQLSRYWWQYSGWIVLEMTVMTYFFALYLYLMDHSMPYFVQLAHCLQYTFLTLIYPYFGINIVGAFIASSQEPASRERETVRFMDANRQVKIVLLKDAILCVEADENYILIRYLENGKVKEYSLRSTMRAIAPMMEQFGLFRCHRSYYVNLSHIVALRKDPNDIISAELDVPDLIIPVSRKVYRELSQRL